LATGLVAVALAGALAEDLVAFFIAIC
jgi:hypothetical protein